MYVTSLLLITLISNQCEDIIYFTSNQVLYSVFISNIHHKLKLIVTHQTKNCESFIVNKINYVLDPTKIHHTQKIYYIILFSWHVQLVPTLASPCLRVVLGGHRRTRRHRHVNRFAWCTFATLRGATRRR